MMEKLQPKLRFPDFTGNWNKIQLNQLLDFKNGINASKEQSGKGVKFINVLDILNNDYITSDNIIGRVDVDEKTISKYLVGYGDILFQRSSETREEVGTANVYLDKNQTAVFGGFVIRGAKIGDYDPVFFNKLLKTDLARNEITSRSGGSTRYNVGQDILSNISLPFPSLPEQQKIASFLTTVDDKISNLKQKVSLLEKYKKGVMQQIFSQQIRFKDENGNDYPEWEEKSLGEVCEFYSGGTPLTTNKKFYNGNIPFIKSGEIGEKETKQFITELGLKNSSAKLVSKGDILYALYGATSGEVSISQINGAINQAVLCIKSSQNQVYLFQYLKYQKDNIVSTYIQGGQGNLSANIIKELNVALPSIKEQTKIAEFLSGIDEKIETTKLQLSKMEVWKKGLLQGMFC